MKKTMFLSLVLVMTLGAMGIGYAAWTDQVTINGTVKTGTVCFEASNPTATYVYKDVAGDDPGADDETLITNVPEDPSDVNLDDDILVSSATAAISGKTVTLTFKNLFPIELPIGVGPDPLLAFAAALNPTLWGAFDDISTIEGEYIAPYVADFDVCNCGTIPIKVWTAGIVIAIGGNADFGYGVLAYNAAGQVVDPNSYQLEPGECLHMVFWMALNEVDRGGVGPDIDNQGLTGSITGTLMAMQWNEEPAGF